MSYINTIADLEAQTYGITGGAFGNQLLKAAGGLSGIHGAHDSAAQTSLQLVLMVIFTTNYTVKRFGLC